MVFSPDNPSAIRDIEGLDAIPALFPLQWGILAAIAFLGLIVIIVLIYWMWRYRLKEYWRRDAYYQLKTLKRQIKQQGDTPELASQFSSLLRRITMTIYGRQSCAGLTDQAWLNWLEQHDPKAFRWSDYEATLLRLPYQNAPTAQTQPAQLRILLKALQPWLYHYPSIPTTPSTSPLDQTPDV